MGFQNDHEIIGRWHINNEIVDIMPTNEKILGFSNKWYPEAIKNANTRDLPNGLTIRVVSPPYFLATKFEAFYGRGKNDFMGSKDIEDIITVIDGRDTLVEEVTHSPEQLQLYLAQQFGTLLNNDVFRESIAGHLMPDSASQARESIILQRLNAIASAE